MDDIIKRADNNIQRAFTRIGRLINQPANKDIQIYESLDVRDFDKLVEIYGTDNVLDYIKTMEAKRMIGDGYGKIKFRNLS